MSSKTNMHAGLMLVLSLLSAFVTVHIIGSPDISSPYGIGYLIGRAFAATLISLAVAAIPAGIYKLFKKVTMPGFYILWWVLWFLIVVLSTFGNIVQGSDI